mmetsp:Transcript_33771/g.78870  ORF Transcript_33771/g.78870 Transcript_33771/m.78870 type:complete len:260 (-) Transcript_33771:548-1327(-)
MYSATQPSSVLSTAHQVAGSPSISLRASQEGAFPATQVTSSPAPPHSRGGTAPACSCPSPIPSRSYKASPAPSSSAYPSPPDCIEWPWPEDAASDGGRGGGARSASSVSNENLTRMNSSTTPRRPEVERRVRSACLAPYGSGSTEHSQNDMAWGSKGQEPCMLFSAATSPGAHRDEISWKCAAHLAARAASAACSPSGQASSCTISTLHQCSPWVPSSTHVSRMRYRSRHRALRLARPSGRNSHSVTSAITPTSPTCAW